MSMSPIRIDPAYDDLKAVRDLFLEYAATVDTDLTYQNFDAEVANLPGKYAPPDGKLLLARADGRIAGCVALRRHDEARCEMKRLFVRSAFQGLGIGRLLAERIVSEARDMGYVSMVLDALERSPAAVTLYRKMGFADIPAYNYSPQHDIVFLEKRL